MHTSPEFVEYIEELLAPVGNIERKRMFGGALFQVGGKQLGVILEDTLFFKITDPDLMERYALEGSKRFQYTRKDKLDPVIIKHWWSVPEAALEDGEELCRLAEEVLGQGE